MIRSISSSIKTRKMSSVNTATFVAALSSLLLVALVLFLEKSSLDKETLSSFSTPSSTKSTTAEVSPSFSTNCSSLELLPSALSKATSSTASSLSCAK